MDRRLHNCEKIGGSTSARAICSYCTAVDISPDKRSSAMKTVIQGEQLQMGILDLLQKSATLVDSDAIGVNLLEVRSAFPFPLRSCQYVTSREGCTALRATVLGKIACFYEPEN
jgi:hypothetical protein